MDVEAIRRAMACARMPDGGAIVLAEELIPSQRRWATLQTRPAPALGPGEPLQVDGDTDPLRRPLIGGARVRCVRRGMRRGGRRRRVEPWRLSRSGRKPGWSRRVAGGVRHRRAGRHLRTYERATRRALERGRHGAHSRPCAPCAGPRLRDDRRARRARRCGRPERTARGNDRPSPASNGGTQVRVGARATLKERLAGDHRGMGHRPARALVRRPKRRRHPAPEGRAWRGGLDASAPGRPRPYAPTRHAIACGPPCRCPPNADCSSVR